MAGSIESMTTAYPKKFKYIPPTPPAELIESTSYTLDFTNRKFVHIGIDPTEKYQVVIHLLSSSRYVKISVDFLKRIFSMMGHILSFILDVPQKYKRSIFLETEFYKISSMMYSGENVLVTESKTEDGCRVLLNRADIIRLQYLECCISECIIRKTVYTAQLIIQQTKEFAVYLREKCDRLETPPKNLEEMIIFVKNAQDERSVKSYPNLTGQIQMFAAIQLAESLLNRTVHESHELQNVKMDSTMLPSTNNVSYTTLMPLNPLDHIGDLQQPHEIHIPQSCDVNDGPNGLRHFSALPSSQLITPPMSDDLKVADEIHASQSCDVNDGPDCFRHFSALSQPQLITPPQSLQPTFTEHPTPVRNVIQQLF